MPGRVGLLSLLLALLLVARLGAQVLPIPPQPRVDGLLSVRVDPARPYVMLEWAAGDISRVSGINYEVCQGPFPDKNPEKLLDKPVRKGHFSGPSGGERVDLTGLPEGEYFIRYQAVGPTGKPASLASNPVRFVVIRGLSRPGSRPADTPTPGSSKTPELTVPTPRPVASLKLVPEQVNLPLGSVQKFWLPADIASAAVAGWLVEGGEAYGQVDAQGVYRAPASMPGSPTALTGYTRLVARLGDGREVEADIVLVRPPRLVAIEPENPILRPGGTLRLRAVVEGSAVGQPCWTLVSGPGKLEPDGQFTAPDKVAQPVRVHVLLTWPGVTQGSDVWIEVVP